MPPNNWRVDSCHVRPLLVMFCNEVRRDLLRDVVWTPSVVECVLSFQLVSSLYLLVQVCWSARNSVFEGPLEWVMLG
jgi:hypothetical protein